MAPHHRQPLTPHQFTIQNGPHRAQFESSRIRLSKVSNSSDVYGSLVGQMSLLKTATKTTTKKPKQNQKQASKSTTNLPQWKVEWFLFKLHSNRLSLLLSITISGCYFHISHHFYTQHVSSCHFNFALFSHWLTMLPAPFPIRLKRKKIGYLKIT